MSILLLVTPLGLPRRVSLRVCDGPCSPRRLLVRWQVRAIRVYRVPLLGVDARGFPGRRLGAWTPRPMFTRVVEAWITLDPTRLVALPYPRRVRGRILLRIWLTHPYVRHLPSPFLVVLERSRSSLKNRSISPQTSRPPL